MIQLKKHEVEVAPEISDAELRDALENMTADELASLIRTVYAAAGGLQ